MSNIFFQGTFSPDANQTFQLLGVDLGSVSVFRIITPNHPTEHFLVGSPSEIVLHSSEPISDTSPYILLYTSFLGAKNLCSPDNQIVDESNVWTTSSTLSNHKLFDTYTLTLQEGNVISFTGDSWNVTPCGDSFTEIPTLPYTVKIPLQTSPVPTPVQATSFSDSSITYTPVQTILSRTPLFQWLNNQDYHIVTPENVREVCQLLMNTPGPLAFDTETTGLGINFTPQSDKLVGIVLAPSATTAYYFPLRHNLIDNICDESEIDSFMEVYMKPLLEQKPLIMFNAPFDMKVMLRYNIHANLLCDVLMLYRLTDWHDQNGVPYTDEWGNPAVKTSKSGYSTTLRSSSLKALSEHFLNQKSLELVNFLPEGFSKKDWSKANFADLPFESVRLYACADGTNTFALYEYFMNNNLVEKYGAGKTLQIETAFAQVQAYAEYWGYHLDPTQLPTLKVEVDKQMDTYYRECVDICGHDFNYNSPKQVAEIMFGDGILSTGLGYPILETTKSGSPSTSKSVMEKLMKITNPDGTPKYPFAVPFYKMADLKTFQRNFLKASEDNINGFLFPKFALLETGRLSTSNPNIQGMPGFVKSYITPREGYYYFDFDFSSIEYRIMASLAQEEGLLEFFQSPFRDYHRRQASVLFQVPYSSVTPAMRKVAKPFNFGLPYGKGDYSMGADLFGEASEENTRKAAELRARYFAGQPKVEEFFEESKRIATEYGWAETYFGRRRYLDPVKLGGEFGVKAGKAKALRAAGNHRIQGTAADLYKMGMIRLYKAVQQKGWEGKIFFSAMVHDETVVEVHNSIAPWEFMDLVLKTVIIDLPGWCPLYIGAGFGSNWYDAKEQDLPVEVQHCIARLNLDWDGDIDKWVDFTEELRQRYYIKMVCDYIADPSNEGNSFDPDMFDFLEKALGSLDTHELAPNLKLLLENLQNPSPDFFTAPQGIPYFPIPENLPSPDTDFDAIYPPLIPEEMVTSSEEKYPQGTSPTTLLNLGQSAEENFTFGNEYGAYADNIAQYGDNFQAFLFEYGSCLPVINDTPYLIIPEVDFELVPLGLLYEHPDELNNPVEIFLFDGSNLTSAGCYCSRMEAINIRYFLLTSNPNSKRFD